MANKRRKSKQMKGGKLLPALLNVCGVLLIVAVIALCAPVTVPRLMGYQPFEVVTGSMEPQIPVGSLVYAQDCDPTQVQEGDVIVFYENGGAVVHRVVTNRTSLGEFVTKGDANESEDLQPIPYDNFVGIVAANYAHLGALESLVASTPGKVYLALTVACGVMFMVLASRIRASRANRKRQLAEALAAMESASGEAASGVAAADGGASGDDALGLLAAGEYVSGDGVAGAGAGVVSNGASGSGSAGGAHTPTYSSAVSDMKAVDTRRNGARSKGNGEAERYHDGAGSSGSAGGAHGAGDSDYSGGPNGVNSPTYSSAVSDMKAVDTRRNGARSKGNGEAERYHEGAGGSKHKRKGRRVWTAVFVVALLVFLGSAGYIAYTMWQYGEADSVYGDAAGKFTGKPDKSGIEAPISVDFDKLRAENPDIVGWIYCEDTPINYPVLQGRDNDQYLHHDYTHAYNIDGSIFVDAANKPGFTDPNTIIYGHHMNSGSMFASLVKWSDQEFYESHPVMWLLTPERNYRIILFSGHKVDAQGPYYDIFHEPGEDLAKLLNNALADSDFDASTKLGDDITLSQNAKYVMLSTCTNLNDTERYVLHGQLNPAS